MNAKSSFKTNFGKTKILESGTGPRRETILLVPGFSEGIPHVKMLLGKLASKGYDALSFSQPRRRGDKSLDPIERQTQVLLDVIDKRTLPGEKIHGVAHSLGAGALLRAAQDQPGKFKSITILEPAGAVGQQGLVELFGRTGKKVVKNQAGVAAGQDSTVYIRKGHYTASADEESRLGFSARVNSAQLSGGVALAKNPALAVSEAVGAGKYDVTDDVRKVAELGIPIHIVKAHSDEMFDSAAVNHGLEPLLEHGVSIHEVADPYARHDTSWMQPERTARIIDQTIHSIQ